MKKGLLIAGRLILGAIFLVAAWAKLREPWLEFAGSIAGFKLLPDWALEPAAKTLPWAELALGVALVSGILQRWFALCASLLLGVFFSAMVRAYILGFQIDCGCFGPGEALGPKTLARDFSMLALAVAVTVASFRAERQPVEETVAESPAAAA